MKNAKWKLENEEDINTCCAALLLLLILLLLLLLLALLLIPSLFGGFVSGSSSSSRSRGSCSSINCSNLVSGFNFHFRLFWIYNSVLYLARGFVDRVLSEHKVVSDMRFVWMCSRRGNDNYGRSENRKQLLMKVKLLLELLCLTLRLIIFSQVHACIKSKLASSPRLRRVPGQRSRFLNCMLASTPRFFESMLASNSTPTKPNDE